VTGSRAAQVFVTLAFGALIGSAGLIQTAAELRRGERPQALEVFERPPTARNLHEFEHALEESSLVMNTTRPWMQEAQFRLLADAGENALVGRDGWLFYRPSVRYATERPVGPRVDAMPAIRSFRDQLAARGIRLLVVPVPNKESIYPEMLTARAEGSGVLVCRPSRSLLDRLRDDRIEVVDLFGVFRQIKENQDPSDTAQLYLKKDSHWTPRGMQIAAKAIALRIRDRGWVETGSVDYDARPVPVERVGDLVRMLQVPRLERSIAPERVVCEQIVRHDDGQPYRDDPNSRILILGDSFLRIYEQDEPQAAGLIAHLARELKQPLTSIVNDGGASTLVRQDLTRRPKFLANKALVIWEFVERDIRDGTEGWQVIPLPKPEPERR
jgi:hypothetical protein